MGVLSERYRNAKEELKDTVRSMFEDREDRTS